MNFESTALYLECAQILQGQKDPAIFHYDVEIRTPASVHRPTKVLSIDITSDYVRDYAPKRIATVAIPYGEFIHHIRPYYQDLSVYVRRTADQLAPVQDQVPVQRYRGILLNIPPAPNMHGTTQEKSELFGDLTNIVEVQLELQEPMLEDIRAITTGTTIQASTPADALAAMITAYTSRLDLAMDEAAVSFDMQPPANTTRQQQISIPHSVPLTSLADYLQSKGGGIYNHSIASFLDRGSWYVWAPFDYSRQDYVEDTLVVLLAPKGKYPGVERTYRTTSRQVVMMVTGDRTHSDESLGEFYNGGNGIRFMDAHAVLEGFDTVDGNTVTVDRSKNATEVMYNDAPTGKVRMRTVKASSNPYMELSKVAHSRGSYMTVVWENANPELLRPDMNVQVMIPDKGSTGVYTGRLLGSSVYIQNTGEGMLSNRFATSMTLTLFVEPTLGRSPIPPKEI